MTFEKTKASAADNTEEDAEKDLKEEEDTSTENDHSEENEDESEEDTSTNDSDDESNDESDDDSEEETVTLKKKDYEKLVTEKENYKTGLISAKAKKRDLGEGTTTEKVDVTEEKINSVLNKKIEKEVLRNVIDAKHSDYIPELVDDAQYAEIITYLPRNIDRSSHSGITRALRLATKMWKEDKGIKDTVASNKKAADVAAVRKTTSGHEAPKKTKVKGERKIIKGGPGMESWFPKN